MQQTLAEFESRGVRVIAISQEDPDLEVAPGILDGMEVEPTFPIAVDVERAATKRLDRATAYLVNGAGQVQQVFPMMTHMRASAMTLVREIDRLR